MMMKIKLASICLALITASTTMAQKLFTLEDLNFGGKNYYNMSPKNLYLTWWGDQLMYQDAEETSTVDMKTGKRTAVATLNDLGKGWHSMMNVTYPYADKSWMLLNNGKERILYDWKKKEIVWRQTSANEEHAAWNKASKTVAFVRNHQLWITTEGGETRQLTTDGSREIVYGQAVHRDEFAIDKGLFWSPDGQHLAFYRMDQSMVEDYPQVNTFTDIASYEPDKYPMAGRRSHEVKVGIYHLGTQQTIYLNTGAPTDRYFTNIRWSPDCKLIYIFELNRDQNDLRLVVYDGQTGEKLREIYHETHEKYVEPLTPIVFLPWDESRFVLSSRKDGYTHLYLYDTSGKEIRQLTKGAFEVERFVGFNTKAKKIIIETNEKHLLQRNLYTVDPNNGKHKLIGSDEGFHHGRISKSGEWLIDYYSAPEIPRNIDLINTANGKLLRLLTAEDPWKGYEQPFFECGTIKAADDSTTLFYRMVKPAHFDPKKKYPTVVYVYGGPHAHMIEASWHYYSRSWETYMAQKGYIVFILDNRGSERRGRDFEQVTFRQLGQAEMADQMRGVDFLKSLPYVDADRLGVHGWSYGGFMTISLMTNYPDVFKVGVAGGPVIDWKWYEVMYGERYMDTPQTNKEGYEKTSLLSKAKDLKGKLQIIIGMNDPVVVPQHALSFINACTEVGTQPDFFVYPGEEHNMLGHKSVHLHERITNYFETYLK